MAIDVIDITKTIPRGDGMPENIVVAVAPVLRNPGEHNYETPSGEGRGRRWVSVPSLPGGIVRVGIGYDFNTMSWVLTTQASLPDSAYGHMPYKRPVLFFEVQQYPHCCGVGQINDFYCDGDISAFGPVMMEVVGRMAYENYYLRNNRYTTIFVTSHKYDGKPVMKYKPFYDLIHDIAEVEGEIQFNNCNSGHTLHQLTYRFPK